MFKFILLLLFECIVSECPRGFTDVLPGITMKYGNCIRILEPANFMVSESECERIHGGRLARPANTRENKAISKQSPTTRDGRYKQMWIGYNDRNNEGMWVDADNQYPSFMNWGTNELGMSNPDNSRRMYEGFFETQDCSAVNFRMCGLWDDDWCTRVHPAACQVKGCDNGCVFDDGECPEGFTDLFPKLPDTQDGNCISFLTESTWENGHVLCAALGAQMVRIENQTFTDKLSLLINERAVEKPPNPVWVGYQRQMVYNHWPLTYHWIDQDSEEASDIKWSIDPITGEIRENIPRRKDGKDEYKDCATILAAESAWDAHYCSEYYKPLCQTRRCFSTETCKLPVTRAHTLHWTRTQPPPTVVNTDTNVSAEPTQSVKSSYRSSTPSRTVLLPILLFLLYLL